MSDWNTGNVESFTSAGIPIAQWGGAGSGDGQFNYVAGIAANGAGEVLVVDWGNHRIQKFTSGGTYVGQWGSQGSGNGQFQNPFGVAVSSAGAVYITDQGNNRVQVFSADGTYQFQWGTAGGGNGQFRGPTGIAIDGGDNVFVVDGAGHLQKFSSTGAFVTGWTTWAPPVLPFGVAVDASGFVYVADADVTKNWIEVFSGSGVLLTTLSNWGSSPARPMLQPSGVAADASGHLYVADYGTQQIEKFGQFATPARRTSWGDIKTRYR